MKSVEESKEWRKSIDESDIQEGYYDSQSEEEAQPELGDRDRRRIEKEQFDRSKEFNRVVKKGEIKLREILRDDTESARKSGLQSYSGTALKEPEGFSYHEESMELEHLESLGDGGNSEFNRVVKLDHNLLGGLNEELDLESEGPSS